MGFRDDMEKAVELSNNIEEFVKNISTTNLKSNNLFKQMATYLAEAKQTTDAIQENMKTAVVEDVRLARDIHKVQKSINALTSDTLKHAQKRKEIEEELASIHAIEVKDRTAEQQKKLKALEHQRRLNNEAYEASHRSLEENLKLEEESLKILREKLRVLSVETKKFENEMSGTMFDPEVGFNPFKKGKDFDKSVGYIQESFEEVADGFSTAISGSLDSVAEGGVKGIKGLGSMLRNASSNRRLRATALEKEGQDVTPMLRMADAMSGLGKGIAVLGGVVAGFLAIFKVMQAIEEAQKAVNKELIDAYGMTDLIVDSTGDVAEQIKKVRQSFTDASFANDLGVPLDQARQMLTELNTIGINMRTMNGDVESMKELTMQLKASSGALGIGFSDAVGYAQNFREEMGLSVKNGELLERMTDEFSKIRDLAMQSSFSTNRFFQVVQGLTEGIGGMNVRVGEAGTLFLKLSKVLGPKAGQQFAQGLTEGFRSEGIQDRMKRIILTGKGKMTQAAMRSARSTFKELGRDKATEAFLARRDIRSAEDMKKLTDDQVKQIMFDMRAQLGDEGSAKALQFLRARDLAKGGTGNMNDLVMALGEFDMSGTLESQMQQVLAFLGPKGFAGASAAQLEALSNYTGKSLQELMDYRKLDFQLQTEYKKAMEVANRTDLSVAQKKKNLEELGITDVMIDQQGNLISKSGEVIKDIGAFVHAQGANMEENKKAKVDDLTLLSEIADATLTSADMINNHLGGLLQQMISPLDYLSSWFGRTEDKGIEDRKRIADELRLSLKDDEDKLADKKKSARAELSKMRLEGAKQSEIEKRDAELKAEIDRDKARLELKKKEARYLTSGQSRGVSGSDIDIRAEARRRVNERLLSTGHGRDTIDQAYDRKNEATRLNLINALKNYKKEGNNVQINEEASFEEVIKLAHQLSEGIIFNEKSNTKYGVSLESSKRFKSILAGLGLDINTDYASGESAIMSPTITDTRRENKNISSERMYKGMADVTALREEPEALRSQLSVLQESRDLLDPDNPAHEKGRKELAEEISKTQAKVLAQDRAYQDATGKTYEEAILRAKKKELESNVQAYLGGKTSFEGMDRNKALEYISNLKDKIGKDGGPTQEQFDLIRQQFRQYYAYDSQMGPDDPRPYLFRRGTLTIGQPQDTAILRDETRRGVASAGGGSSVASNVVININGGDQRKVYNTVMDAMSKANRLSQV